MGWRYNIISKNFYTDGHDNLTKVIHRNHMCEKYITEWEPRSHRWVKTKKEELSILQRDGPIPGDLKYYKYKGNGSVLWNVDLHFNSCDYCFKIGS